MANAWQQLAYDLGVQDRRKNRGYMLFEQETQVAIAEQHPAKTWRLMPRRDQRVAKQLFEQCYVDARKQAQR